MPFAITHILVPLILAALFKDLYERKTKKKFSLHYVLIAGLAGIIPDLDVALFWLLNFFSNTEYDIIHKTYAHSLLVPLIFLILFIALKNTNAKARICNIGKHKLNLSIIFLAISFGSLTHIILDIIFSQPFLIFLPFTNFQAGFNLLSQLPTDLQDIALHSMEAALLIIWLAYLELKHKVSDFI